MFNPCCCGGCSDCTTCSASDLNAKSCTVAFSGFSGTTFGCPVTPLDTTFILGGTPSRASNGATYGTGGPPCSCQWSYSSPGTSPRIVITASLRYSTASYSAHTVCFAGPSSFASSFVAAGHSEIDICLLVNCGGAIQCCWYYLDAGAMQYDCNYLSGGVTIPFNANESLPGIYPGYFFDGATGTCTFSLV
jgi:hypothetical protein